MYAFQEPAITRWWWFKADEVKKSCPFSLNRHWLMANRLGISFAFLLLALLVLLLLFLLIQSTIKESCDDFVKFKNQLKCSTFTRRLLSISRIISIKTMMTRTCTHGKREMLCEYVFGMKLISQQAMMMIDDIA